jgi:hypothetical protein
MMRFHDEMCLVIGKLIRTLGDREKSGRTVPFPVTLCQKTPGNSEVYQGVFNPQGLTSGVGDYVDLATDNEKKAYHGYSPPTVD